VILSWHCPCFQEIEWIAFIKTVSADYGTSCFQTSMIQKKKSRMVQHLFVIHAIVLGCFVGLLGCGANSSEDDRPAPIPQGQGNQDSIKNKTKTPEGESPQEPNDQNDRDPQENGHQKAAEKTPPSKGAQNSRPPTAPPSAANPVLGGVTPQPKSNDVILQKAAESLVQVRVELSRSNAASEVVASFSDLDSGLKDLKSVKDQPSTFAISRELFCAQSAAFSLSLLVDKSIGPNRKDRLESLLETFHQPGELCGDS
jgi:hypothetical protein